MELRSRTKRRSFHQSCLGPKVKNSRDDGMIDAQGLAPETIEVVPKTAVPIETQKWPLLPRKNVIFDKKVATFGLEEIAKTRGNRPAKG